MKKKNTISKPGSMKILWAVVPILLCVATCAFGLLVGPGDPVPINSTVNDFVTVLNGGTLNMYPGALVWGITVQAGGVVNFYGGGPLPGAVTDVAANASVTVYGTNLVASPDTPWDDVTTVTGDYANGGGPISLIFGLPGGVSGTVNEDGTIWKFTSVVSIDIDIKPGSYPNSINLGSLGVVPVAILSTDGFDATTAIDRDTIELAGAGVAVRGKADKLMASEEDVDGDGLLDLVVKVDTENLQPGTFQDGGAILTATNVDGQTSYEGWDEITIVPPE